MRPTLASQSMLGMVTSILHKEGKTNEYGSSINTSKYTYLYDCQIMTLDAKTCHKNEYKSNDNHHTR